MRASGSGGFGIPALAIVLLATVAADVARRALRHPEPANPPPAGGASRSGRSVAADSAGSPVPGRPRRAQADAGTGRLDPDARRLVLQRIAVEGAGTYLPAMLSEGDSVLHRWGDDRASRSLRVLVRRNAVPGFTAGFLVAVSGAIARWNAVGLPVGLQETPDSTGADIVVSWSEQLDSNRTGRTDVTWQSRGPIVHADIILATHLPSGQLVVPAQMAALALHELGHALGLNHSPDRSDAMYPETSATELALRDRRTALLLYALPPGDLK